MLVSIKNVNGMSANWQFAPTSLADRKTHYMNKASKFHLILVSIVNLAIIARLINMAWDGNDKAILIVIFCYPLVIIANAAVWLILWLTKHPSYKIYKITTIGLLILLIPTICLSSLY